MFFLEASFLANSLVSVQCPFEVPGHSSSHMTTCSRESGNSGCQVRFRLNQNLSHCRFHSVILALGTAQNNSTFFFHETLSLGCLNIALFYLFLLPVLSHHPGLCLSPHGPYSKAVPRAKGNPAEMA